MKNVLEIIKNNENISQEAITTKLKSGLPLSDEEVLAYKLTDEDKEVYKIINKVLDGNYVSGFDFMDFLATPQARILIPRTIIGTMRQASDPMYLASTFFKKVRIKGNQGIIFPSIGVMKAHDIAEGAEIPQETITWQQHRDGFIATGKVGVRVQFTEDLLRACEFDIISLMLSEAGRSLGRHAEQKAYTEWISHGFTVFDNALRKKRSC